MSHSFAAGQGGATLRISPVVGAGLTQQEGVCSHTRTDRGVGNRPVTSRIDSAGGN